jgi:hypothetical protein
MIVPNQVLPAGHGWPDQEVWSIVPPSDIVVFRRVMKVVAGARQVLRAVDGLPAAGAQGEAMQAIDRGGNTGERGNA